MSGNYITGIVTDKGEAAYDIPVNIPFNEKIRAVKDSDPVSASGIVNPLIQSIIDNIFAVKNMAETSEAVVSGTEPPPASCALWMKNLGTIARLDDWDSVLYGWNGGVGGSTFPVNLTAYFGETPPADTTSLWFKPESTQGAGGQ